MSDIEEIAASALYFLSTCNYYLQLHASLKMKEKNKKEKKKRKQNIKNSEKRRFWVMNLHRNITEESTEEQFMELLREPSGTFSNFCRMSSADFEYLLNKISPIIAKKDTGWRGLIPPKVRLAVTLRYLATGESYTTLHFLFKISSQTISRILPEVCSALNTVLKDEIRMPGNSENWLSKSGGFKFPHCVGVLSGKHVVMSYPSQSDFQYYNNNEVSFSVVLLASVDSDFQFTFVDVGCQGRISDGAVFRRSALWRNMSTDTLNLPPACPLPGGEADLPYVFAADGAFPLHPNVMNPFPGDHDAGSLEGIFNDRLSGVCIVAENTFGIMCTVFGVFRKPISLNVRETTLVTTTCALLHNFLRTSATSRDVYTPVGALDTLENGELVHGGSWRRNPKQCLGLRSLPAVDHRSMSDAVQTRLDFANYFYHNG